MPDKTACPRCKKIGFVRLETVLSRGKEIRSFYCGACDHSWEISSEGQQSSPQPGTIDRPDRSRTP